MTDDELEEPPSETAALWLAEILKMDQAVLDSFVARTSRFWRLTPELLAAIALRRSALDRLDLPPLPPGVEHDGR